MFHNAALVGVALVLTLGAGLGLEYLERYLLDRALLPRPFSRPGAIALLVGTGLAALFAGHLRGNAFVFAAAVFACVSGVPFLRRGGQLPSFLFLWAGAAGVVVVLGARIPAFGVPWADVALSSFFLAAFCSMLREWDAAGSFGWLAAMGTAGGVTVLCHELHRYGDTSFGILFVAALFGVVAAAPFGSGMLSRIGSRFVGLVVGGMAIRAAVDAPVPMTAVAIAGVACAVLWMVSLGRPYRLRVLLGTAVVAVLMALASVPALKTLRDVYQPMNATVLASRGLMKTEPKVGLANAAARLGPIEMSFRKYSNRLDKPQVRVARFVPFVGANVRTVTASAHAAADLSSAARALLEQVNVGLVRPKRGVVSRDDLGKLSDGLGSLQFLIDRSSHNVTAGGSELLVPALRRGVDVLLTQMHTVRRRIGVTQLGVATADKFLGFGRPHKFFIAVQNSAESRATGGYIANYGVVTVENGRITARQFKRTSLFDDATDRPRVLRAPLDFRRRYSQFDVASSWPNVNMSPDFPTVARVIADQYRQYSGEKLDGVIAVDPPGMAQLMRLTGPLTVSPWPVPLTPENATKITLHDEYVAFDARPQERIDFLGRVANQLFDVLVAKGFDNLLRAAPVIHDLTATRHLQFWTPDVDAAHFFRITKADGHVVAPATDGVLVTTQNAAGNKADYFLRRSLRYEATVQRKGTGVRVDSTLKVTLRNDAPAAGEPSYIIGPHDTRFQPGQNRLYFTVYSPLDLQAATIDGKKLRLDAQPELDRTARSAFIDIPARSTRVIELRFSGVRPHNHRYVLNVGHQPTITDEPLELLLHGVGRRGEVAAHAVVNRDLSVNVAVR